MEPIQVYHEPQPQDQMTDNQSHCIQNTASQQRNMPGMHCPCITEGWDFAAGHTLNPSKILFD